MRLKNTTIKYTVQFLACLGIFFCVFTTSSANADILFEDNFDEFQSFSWNAMSIGAPALSKYTSNGDTFLRMTSIMSDYQQRGIETTSTFNFSQGQIITDFRTMPFSDPSVTADNKENIDGLLVFMLFSDTAPMMGLAIEGWNFGEERRAVIFGDNVNVQSSSSEMWDYEQDYRFLITSSGGDTHMSFQNAASQELFGYTFDFNLATIGEFNIQMIQEMGTPGGEYYSDVALDYLRVSSVPIPSALWLLGSGLIGIVGFRKKYK